MFIISQVLLTVLIITISYLIYRHFQTMQRLKFYKAQGVYIADGAYRFFFGNMPEVELHRTAAKTSALPVETPFVWLTNKLAAENGDARFDAQKYPIVYYNIVGTATLVVQDP